MNAQTSDQMAPLSDSIPVLPYWGKARPTSGSSPEAAWHPLVHHCLDVAAVGFEALKRMPALRSFLSRQVDLSDEPLMRWTAFWLALHDLGKFAESFQSQCPDIFLSLRRRPPNPAKPYTLRHDSLGMLFWMEVLRGRVIEELWFGENTLDLADGLDYWARACTGHHGQPPTEGDHWGQHFDMQQDLAATMAFVDTARDLFLDSDVKNSIARLESGQFLAASQAISWWLAGLTVLADWLGSNTRYFAYRAEAQPPIEYWKYALRQAATALDASGVVAPASAAPMKFTALFPHIESPSPLQHWVSNVPLASGPQIHLLEDVTGAGKTEAALMLTHRLMADGCADGFYLALPTMATANAMYGRLAASYRRLFAVPTSLVLATSQRSMVEEFAATVLPADAEKHDPRQQDETASARCTAWLADHNKRALLSPAGVGTIDQALLAVLHSKHQSLRLLGMMHKVLVVDEVHACDVYMQGVLARLLEFHARGGGSAILLSATLPQRTRQELLAAFARGLGAAAPRVAAVAYPLVSSWDTGQCATVIEKQIATRADVYRRVDVHCTSDLTTVKMAIEQALATGRCVCWVRNTVADAIEAYEEFLPQLETDRLMLFHARFALRDRLDMEERVLAAFGKTSTPDKRAGRLLIGTQVVEQSLDVDFDLLVSDLAPIDRIIQRAGRLCRHPRAADGTPLTNPAAPDERGVPRLLVLAPAWSNEPDANWYRSAFAKAAAVYPHHGQLWLTAQALREGGFIMPNDARRLIERVFGAAADVPAGLQANALVAEGHGFAALAQAQMNALAFARGYQRGGSDWWSEAKTPSRLGEATSTVALARWVDGRLRPWVDGPHGWAYSGLQVAARLIDAEALQPDPTLQAELESTRAELPAEGRWTVLLPLTETPTGWVGEALAAPRKGQPTRRLVWTYDRERGLRVYEPVSNEAALKEDPET